MIGNLWICVFQCMTVSWLANDAAMHWRHWFTIVSDVNFNYECSAYSILPWLKICTPKWLQKFKIRNSLSEMPRAQYISRIAPAADDLARQSLTTSDQLLAHDGWQFIAYVMISQVYFCIFLQMDAWNVHSTNPPRFTWGSGQSFTWHLTIPISS